MVRVGHRLLEEDRLSKTLLQLIGNCQGVTQNHWCNTCADNNIINFVQELFPGLMF